MTKVAPVGLCALLPPGKAMRVGVLAIVQRHDGRGAADADEVRPEKHGVVESQMTLVPSVLHKWPLVRVVTVPTRFQFTCADAAPLVRTTQQETRTAKATRSRHGGQRRREGGEAISYRKRNGENSLILQVFHVFRQSFEKPPLAE